MKTKLILISLLITQICFAQQVSVLSLEKIKEPDKNGGYFYPKISPNNDYVLMTRGDYSGLYKFSFDDKSTYTLNEDHGAGYNVKISDDGEKVLYQKIELLNRRRYNALIYQSIEDNVKTIIEKPTREVITARLIKNEPLYIKGRKIVGNKLLTRAAGNQYIATIEHRQLILYKNGKREVLSPNGKNESYIWPSVSPDHKHIVYTVAGKGTFVATINGKSVRSLGKLGAPKWLNNDLIIGMDDVDDGEKLISSKLVVSSLSGEYRTTLATPAKINAMYPFPSQDGTKVVFNTNLGEIYVMYISIK